MQDYDSSEFDKQLQNVIPHILVAFIGSSLKWKINIICDLTLLENIIEENKFYSKRYKRRLISKG